MTELSKLGLVAVLQRRGEFNHEKLEEILKGGNDDGFGESFPGGCNLTVWGGMKENETPMEAIIRETYEEMGEDLGEMFDFNWHVAKEIYRFEDDKNLKIAFGLKVSCDILLDLHFNASSGGIHILTEDKVDEIQDLAKFDKKIGVLDRSVIALYFDCRQAIKNAFAMFKNPTS